MTPNQARAEIEALLTEMTAEMQPGDQLNVQRDAHGFDVWLSRPVQIRRRTT